MSTTETVKSLKDYASIPIADLIESSTNPRKAFDEERLKELAESIRSKGVLSPLVVRAADSFSVGAALEDTKLYFTAPLRWDEQDWLYFGGTLVAVGVANQFDHKVRDHFAVGSKAILASVKPEYALPIFTSRSPSRTAKV